MYSANCTAGRAPSVGFLDDASNPGDRTSVACLSRVCHKSVLIQLTGLVVAGLENGSSSHSRLGRCNQREVLARDSQENLPRDGELVLYCSCKTEKFFETHMLAVSVL